MGSGLRGVQPLSNRLSFATLVCQPIAVPTV
ncbi:hypothetical protein [Plasmodium yoelii yoelii]|uniref:Uncharacterized protein n=1 Tax=Plasmodium yoelii yoelii TaxID=73239 RepID=Q7PDC8_PLAYO|nr:hypothetical protein [Plasmodium yoelii yoelii]EAA21326.1 hypothetical protein [Plasmodium yoelii yoelii]